MTHHLGYDKHSKSERNNLDLIDNNNYRNGHSTKRLITDDGEFSINSPRDRDGSFEPQIVNKRQNRFSGFDDNVISMYSRGMTVKEIQ
jgi:transposase-like protein